MSKSLFIIILSILMQHYAQAQAKLGFENYNAIKKAEPYMWMPIISRTGRKGLHGEFRYNYEENRTGSVYIGKNFRRDSVFSYSVTPMAGWVFGQYNGGSIAMNLDAGYKRFYFSVQPQYTISKESREANFFYAWGEIGYEATNWLYTGLSSQYTRVYDKKAETEFGVLVGFNINKISIPVYVFSPLNSERNFLIGVNLEL